MPTSVRKASVVVVAPGGKASAEGITLTAAINSAPTVEVLLRRSATDVAEPLSAEMLAAMRVIQEARFEPKTTAFDTDIVAEDGNGGTLHFRGYTVAPVLEQSRISNAETIKVVGCDAFLDGLGLSIYQSMPGQIRKEESAALFTATPSRTTGDVAATMREVTAVLVGNLAATLDAVSTPSLAEVIQLKHDANKLPLEAWRTVLGNSDVKYPTWETAFKRAPKLGEAVVERVLELLQQRSGSFWGTIASLASEFQFFYRPSTTGLSGKFVRADQKSGPDDLNVKTLKAGVVRFTASDGSANMLALGGVILYGPVMPGIRREESAVGRQGVVGRWPEDITAGYFYEAAAPPWLGTGGVGCFLPFARKGVMDPPSAPAQVNLDPAAYAGRAKEFAQHLEKVEEDVGQVLRDYAKTIYLDMRLADSTATLEVPLDFTVEVGVRYRFQLNNENGGYFTGFVRGLRHTLQLQGGDQLTSGTTLSITHIQYF